ncbi:hypothetical protein H8356DRAFT_1427836 [Neocallimastix lanati (nom. inval.)]|nr:hypothetical protein H8356DRAFT_1427836 [Neocallimastix sp. JGI-2020a]
MSFDVPETTKMSVVESQLRREGFSKGDKRELVSKDDVCVAKRSKKYLKMKNYLFYLRSLLILVKDDKNKLLEYDSYYQDDPCEESSNRLYSLGPSESQKMFSEDYFSDMQLVLEFSRLARVQKIGFETSANATFCSCVTARKREKVFEEDSLFLEDFIVCENDDKKGSKRTTVKFKLKAIKDMQCIFLSNYKERGALKILNKLHMRVPKEISVYKEEGLLTRFSPLIDTVYRMKETTKLPNIF